MGPAAVAVFEKACREHGLPVTAQRRLVFQILTGRRDHPTADDIYKKAVRRMPEVSRTTIYRVLDTLVRIGVVRRVHPDTAVRYECRTARHHHLVCLDCGAVVDVTEPALDNLPVPERTSGFVVEDYSVHFRGLCGRCATTSPNQIRSGSSTRKRTK